MKKTQYKWRKVGGKGSQAGYGGPRYGALYTEAAKTGCVATLMGEDMRRSWNYDVVGQRNGFRRSGSGHNFEVAQYRAEEALSACTAASPLRGLTCLGGNCGPVGSLFSDFTSKTAKQAKAVASKVTRAGKKAWKKARSR